MTWRAVFSASTCEKFNRHGAGAAGEIAESNEAIWKLTTGVKLHDRAEKANAAKGFFALRRVFSQACR